jgi:hypothetical protein
MEDTAPTVINDNVSKDVPATPAKYRSSAYRGNARGLGKHEKQTGEDNYTMLQGTSYPSSPYPSLAWIEDDGVVRCSGVYVLTLLLSP